MRNFPDRCSFPGCRSEKAVGEKCRYHARKDREYRAWRRKTSGCTHCATNPHKAWCRNV